MTTVSFSGHRPNKLNFEYDGGPLTSKIKNALIKELTNITAIKGGIKTAYTGMALGIDQLAAEICVSLMIPFIAAVPCAGQEMVWPQKSQDRYRQLLSKAQEVVTIAPAYTTQCMQARNIFMVDMSDILLAVWDGSSGGTGNCVKYAKSISKEVIVINPREL